MTRRGPCCSVIDFCLDTAGSSEPRTDPACHADAGVRTAADQRGEGQRSLQVSPPWCAKPSPDPSLRTSPQKLEGNLNNNDLFTRLRTASYLPPSV